MSARIASTTARLHRYLQMLAVLTVLAVAVALAPQSVTYAQGPASASAVRATAVAATRDRYHAMKQAQFERHAGAVKARTLVTPSLARLRYEDMKDRTYLRRMP